MKPSLHLLLPAGGMKGCFQAGFLYNLWKKYHAYYTIYLIEGVSVGAINGYAFSLHQLDYLKNMWNKISCRDDLFCNLSKIPGINYLKMGYNAIFGFNIYSNSKIKDYLTIQKYTRNIEAQTSSENIEDSPSTNIVSSIIDSMIDRIVHHHSSSSETADEFTSPSPLLMETEPDISIDLLPRYRCVVSNINKGEPEYIPGTIENISEYVLASASPWIISEPITIDSSLYTDGALFECFTIQHIESSEADKIVIVGYDACHDHLNNGSGSNMLEYLAHLIDILRYHRHIQQKQVLELESVQQKLVIIPNTICNSDFLNLHPETIQQGFKDGQYAADQFFIEHLQL